MTSTVINRYDYAAAVSADLRNWLAAHEIPDFADDDARWDYLNDLAYSKDVGIITGGRAYDADHVRDWIGSNMELLSGTIAERDGDNLDFAQYLIDGAWHEIDLLIREHVFFQVAPQIIEDCRAEQRKGI